MAGVDQEFRLTEVTLTESIEALLPKSGRDTNPRPFFENSLDKVLDLDVIENDEPTELSLLSDATEDSLKLGFFFLIYVQLNSKTLVRSIECMM